jgi:hypothetical protein
LYVRIAATCLQNRPAPSAAGSLGLVDSARRPPYLSRIPRIWAPRQDRFRRPGALHLIEICSEAVKRIGRPDRGGQRDRSSGAPLDSLPVSLTLPNPRFRRVPSSPRTRWRTTAWMSRTRQSDCRSPGGVLAGHVLPQLELATKRPKTRTAPPGVILPGLVLDQILDGLHKSPDHVGVMLNRTVRSG